MVARVGVALCVLSAGLWAQSWLVEVPGRRAHVFDGTRGLLYVSTSAGEVVRYDPAARAFLAPLQVGQALSGLDITPGDDALYVGEGVIAGGQAFVHRVDLATEAVTTLAFPLAEANEIGVRDLCIASNGKALVSTGFLGSGKVPLRELELATGEFSIRDDAPDPSGEVQDDTFFHRAGDRSRLLMLETGSTAGDAHVYDADVDTFVLAKSYGTFLRAGAVSPDGERAAVSYGESFIGIGYFGETKLCNASTLDFCVTRPYAAGLVFDPVRDVLYLADPLDDRIVAYRSQSPVTEIASLPIGEDVGVHQPLGPGEMSMSADGLYLFLSTPAGIRVYPGPLPPVVQSVEPPRGGWDTPTTVTLTGEQFLFSPVAGVRFGDLPASDVVVVDDETITCTTPVGVPGPTGVRVDAEVVPGAALDDAFRYTPAAVVAEPPLLGGSLALELLVEPGQDVVLIWGVPPAVSVSLGGYAFPLGILPPLVLLQLHAWPFDNVALVLPVPPDPLLDGVELLFQVLVGDDAPAPPGTFGNVASVTLVAG